MLSNIQIWNQSYLNIQPAILQVIGWTLTLILLLLSACLSASQIAFFSLTPDQITELKKKQTTNSQNILTILEKPHKLLACLSILKYTLIISIIIISGALLRQIYQQNNSIGLQITILILLFTAFILTEILPKQYAHHTPLSVAQRVAGILKILTRILHSISRLLIYSSNMMQKHTNEQKNNFSLEDYSQALNLSTEAHKEDRKIIEGIVRFKNINVRSVMSPRIDIFAIDCYTNFKKLLNYIKESSYSRIPIYSHTLDSIQGILYIKDLLDKLDKDEDFRWTDLIRPPYYVPETKKIADLLIEFQSKKNHLAIVIDEYGGTAGIITMEDILEEIIGEINDEFDKEENPYYQIDNNNYIFEAKTFLNVFCEILHYPTDYWDTLRGEADTLAGLILEITGEIPFKNQVIECNDFIFKILSVDNRKINKIKVTIITKNQQNETTNQ